MSTNDARRNNVRRLIQDRFDGITAAFARAIDRDDAQVWQFLNQRPIGEKLARDIEAKLGLEANALDHEQTRPAFARRLDAQEPVAVAYGRSVPVVGTAQLGDDGHYEALDYPTGHGDGFVTYPTRDANAYALRVKGDSMRPRIKPGEFVLIEPNTTPEPGDEVLVKTTDGRAMVKVLDFRRNGVVQLSSINEEHRPITLEESQVERLHYVAAILKATLYYRDIS